MNRVENIIFNELAAHRAVALPRIGTLRVVRHPARVVGGVVTPPHNFVTYSLETDGDIPTVLDLGADDNEYAAWLAGAMNEGVLRIDGVGTLILGEFTPCEELERALNPSIVQAAKCDDIVNWRPASPTMVTPTPPRSGTEDRSTRYDYYTEHFLKGEQRRVVRTRNIVLIIVAVLLVAAWLMLFGWFHTPHRMEEVVVTHEVVSVPVPLPAPEPVSEPVVETVAEPEFHLIAGSFTDLEQAEKTAARYARRFPDLEVTTLENETGHTLVSIFSGSTRREAYNKFYKLAERTGNWDMWVYEVPTDTPRASTQGVQ